jgi:tocopherol O-methyltransferase
MSGDVQRYYDTNTPRFLRFGKGKTRSIHRALRVPGAPSLADAYYVSDDLVADAITPAITDSHNETPIVADLGCGVGASIEYLSQRIDARFVGITLSAVQAAIASTSVSTRASYAVGDFARDDTYRSILGDATLDAAYMIESWNHTADPDRLLQLLSRRIRRGGILVLCDDFPAEAALEYDHLRPRDRRRLDEFIAGWHVHTFLPTERVVARAERYRFHEIETRELTDWVVVGRPRDHLVRVFAGIARIFDAAGFHRLVDRPWWHNIRGGNALQQLEKRGLVRYRFVVLRRE